MKSLHINFSRLYKLYSVFLPPLILSSLVILFFWQVFLFGKIPIPMDLMLSGYYPWIDYRWANQAGAVVNNPITSDVFSFIYPMQSFAASLIKQSILPLWNPYMLGGSVLLGNFQSAPFSTLNLLHLFFNNATTWSLQVVLQHILAALFTYLLLRHWKISKSAAIVGGIIYAFCGFNLIWSEWKSLTLTAAYFPLVVFAADRLLVSKRLRDGALLSLTLACQLVSGYPQLVLYTFMALGILYLIRTKGINIKSSVVFAVFIILGIGLAAMQVLPGYELLSLSQRGSENYTFEWAFLPWEKVITFIAPNYFGNHASASYWGPLNYTSNTGFVGVVAMLLATVMIVQLRKKAFYIYFAISIGILALLLSFPTPVAVSLWKSGVFGLNAAAAHRSLFLFNFSIAILAAAGIDMLKNKNFKINIFSILIPLVLLITFVIYAFSLSDENRYTALWNLLLPGGIYICVVTALFISKYRVLKRLSYLILVLLTITELFTFGWGYTPFANHENLYPATPVINFLKSQQKPFRVVGNEVMPVNTRMVYDIESAEGYDAMYPVRLAEYISAINKKSPKSAHVRYAIVDNLESPLLDILNTKYFLVLKKNDLGNPDINGFVPSLGNRKVVKVFEDKHVAVLENLESLPRSFVSYNWEVIPEKDDIINRLLDPKFIYHSSIILEERPSTLKPDIQGEFTTDIKSMESGKVEINVKSTQAGMLFLSDTYYPGWVARVDGIEEKIYRANYAFRAIPVPAGESSVVFSYEPTSFKFGTTISLLSLSVLTLAYFLGKSKLWGYTEPSKLLE